MPEAIPLMGTMMETKLIQLQETALEGNIPLAVIDGRIRIPTISSPLDLLAIQATATRVVAATEELVAGVTEETPEELTRGFPT